MGQAIVPIKRSLMCAHRSIASRGCSHTCDVRFIYRKLVTSRQLCLSSRHALHTMDTVKSLLSPLTGASNPLQDTLVRIRALLSLYLPHDAHGRNLSLSEGPLKRLDAFQFRPGMASLIVSGLS